MSRRAPRKRVNGSQKNRLGGVSCRVSAPDSCRLPERSGYKRYKMCHAGRYSGVQLTKIHASTQD
jgi:hypothetical protein